MEIYSLDAFRFQRVLAHVPVSDFNRGINALVEALEELLYIFSRKCSNKVTEVCYFDMVGSESFSFSRFSRFSQHFCQMNVPFVAFVSFPIWLDDFIDLFECITFVYGFSKTKMLVKTVEEIFVLSQKLGLVDILLSCFTFHTEENAFLFYHEYTQRSVNFLVD